LLFNSHIGNANINLLKGSSVHIKDTKNIFCTILSKYTEKKVSQPNHQPNTNKNDDNEINLTDTGKEKNFFFITEKSQL
jgi:hypothetical protein